MGRLIVGQFSAGTGVGTGPADAAPARPISRQTIIFTFTTLLYQRS